MTPEAQQVAIAQHCGWVWQKGTPPSYGGTNVPRGWYNPLTNRLYQRLPDYLVDLNAIHAAEEQAGMEVIKAMRFHLWILCDQMTAHHATAAQRCEAFLLATGLWRVE